MSNWKDLILANIATVDSVADAIKVVTDALPDSGALTSIAQDSTVAKAADLATVDTVVDAIKVVTDAIPDAGAMTSIAQASALATVDTVVDAIKLVTDALPDSGALTSLATAANLATVDSVVDAIKLITDALPDSGALTSLAQDADIGTPVNTGGTATISAILGDAANTSIVSRLGTIDSAVSALTNNTDTYISSHGQTFLIPDAGNEANRIGVSAFSSGTLNDPDSNIVAATLTQADGTDISSRLYKDSAFAAALDTQSGGTFDGLKILEKDSTGRYFAYYKSESTHSEETANLQIQYEEGAALKGRDSNLGLRNNLPASVATVANQTSIEGKIDTVDTVVDAIKAVTDLLPDAGALSSLAQDSDIGTLVNTGGTATLGGILGDVANVSVATRLGTIDTVVDGIKAVTDALPDSGALTSLATAAALTTVDSVVDAIKLVTDALPDSGALTSLAQDADIGTLTNTGGTATIGAILGDVANVSMATRLGTIDTVVDGIKAVTDNLPDSGALSSLATASAVAVIDGFHDVPSADAATNLQMRDVIGNKSDTSSGTSIVALIKQVLAAGGGEPAGTRQAEIDINASVSTETDLFNEATAGHVYTLDGLRVKVANPAANTVTIKLYQNINDVLTEIDSFAIDSTNYTYHHSLMDMFGVPDVTSEEVKVTATASSGTYAVTGAANHIDKTL